MVFKYSTISYRPSLDPLVTESNHLTNPPIPTIAMKIDHMANPPPPTSPKGDDMILERPSIEEDFCAQCPKAKAESSWATHSILLLHNCLAFNLP